MSTRVVAGLGVASLVLVLIAIGRSTHPASAQRRPSAAEASAALGKAPIPRDDAEKRILEVLASIKADSSRQFRNVSPDDGRLMRQITEAMDAKVVVEIGTSTGYSGLWFALALRGTGGKLITFDIDEGRIAIAREHFRRAGVEELVTIVHGDAHEKVLELQDPIDVLFLDADKAGYIDYLEKLLPRIRPGGVILAHNMVSPRPDPRFIDAITTSPDLDTSFVLMDGAGLSLTMKKR